MNGNMLTGLGGKVMAYVGENRPLSVVLTGKKTCYVYGADGKRLKKVENLAPAQDCATIPASAPATVYFGPVEVRNWKMAGEQVLTYPHPTVKLTDGTTPTEATYLHRDHLGSVRAITTPAGVEIESTIYRPFGELTEWIGAGQTAPETKGWIGERYDADAGLQYLNARYYDPFVGMFLQPDWFEVTEAGVGTNRYAYCGGDPINCSDTNGNVPDNWATKKNRVAYDSNGYKHEWSERYRRSEVTKYKTWNDKRHADNAANYISSGKANYGNWDGVEVTYTTDLGETSLKYAYPKGVYDYGVIASGATASGDAIFDVFSLGATAVVRVGARAIAKSVEPAAEASFFAGTQYTQKVLKDMSQGVGELHSFPEAVVAFEKSGTIFSVKGGDGVIREMLEIPGSYATTIEVVKQGVFQFMKEADGMINHRFFKARP